MTGQILTSWKEIAAYLGKGVRTVQRWETEFSLPVRRPTSDRHIVLAFPTELDDWAHRSKPNSESGHRERASAELNRTRTLVATMRDRVVANREHTIRLVEQCQKPTMLQALRTDVKVGLTFAGVAFTAAEGSNNRIRNQVNALKAYEAVLRLSKRTRLKETDQQQVADGLRRLKSALEALGESFHQCESR
jgi:hypothetical protein